MQRERPLAAWALIRDLLATSKKPNRIGPFITSLVSFFLAEMRDKTQFDPLGLTAKYTSLTMVVLRTTLGMMAANVLAVFLGKRLARYMPLFEIRFNAATFFAAFGRLILLKVPVGLGLQ